MPKYDVIVAIGCIEHIGYNGFANLFELIQKYYSEFVLLNNNSVFVFSSLRIFEMGRSIFDLYFYSKLQ